MVAGGSRSKQGIDLIDKDLDNSLLHQLEAPNGTVIGAERLTMVGCNLVARENNPATSLLDSPNHLFILHSRSVSTLRPKT